MIHFDHIHSLLPCSSQTQIPLLFTHTKLCVLLFCVLTHREQYSLPKSSGMLGIQLECDPLTKGYTLREKSDFLSPNIYQCLIAPRGGTSCPPPLHILVWLEVVCASYHNPYMSISHHSHPFPLVLILFSVISSTMVPSP